MRIKPLNIDRYRDYVLWCFIDNRDSLDLFFNREKENYSTDDFYEDLSFSSDEEFNKLILYKNRDGISIINSIDTSKLTNQDFINKIKLLTL